MSAIKREIQIAPTPEELAACLADMHSTEQAKFFDELARIMGTWPAHARLVQCAYIREDFARRYPDEPFDAFELLRELNPEPLP